ncbi:MAG: YdcH family protein [Acetobacterales bacterium]
MAKDDRLLSLKAKHADLEQAIHDESIRPSPDELVVHQLKKQKLQIKDQIVNLQTA